MTANGLCDLRISPSRQDETAAEPPATVQRSASCDAATGPVWPWFVVPAIGYFLLARLGLMFVLRSEQIAAVWPASGLALAAFTLARGRRRRWAVIAGVAFGCAGAQLMKRPGLTPLFFVLPNVLGLLIAGTLLRLGDPERELDFGRVADLMRLVFAGMVAVCLGAAPLGAWVATRLFDAPSFAESCRAWAAADGLGILIVTPFVVGVWREWPPRLRNMSVEGVLAQLTVAWVSHYLFNTDPLVGALPLLATPSAILMPLLIWAGLRLTPRGVATACLLVAFTAAWHTVAGRGPFAAWPGRTHGQCIVAFQFAMTAWAMCGLTLGAATEERRRAIRVAQAGAVALARREDRLRLALEAGGMGTFTVDLNRDVAVHDEQLNRLHGLESNVKQWPFFARLAHVHPDDRDRMKKLLDDLIAAGPGTDLSNEFRILRPDGTVRWLYNAVRMCGPSEIVGVHMDVTEQHQDKEDLRIAKEAAEAASRAKSQFLAHMSHEIRTPLTAIFGYADLLLLSQLNDAERRESVQIIRSNGEHLLAIINDILDLSKIEAGRMSVERTPIDLAKLLGDLLSQTRQRASAKGLALDIRFVTPIPESVVSDPMRLRQILLNLVGNAVKFTSRGGVVVRAGFDESTSILSIAVEDTGIGMTPAQADKIFAAFSQGDDSYARLYGGTGLGLSISKRLAKLLGGDVTFATAQGKGSTFTLNIPAAASPNARRINALPTEDSAPRPDDAPLAQSHQGRVLLAEDSVDSQRLISTYLRHIGAEVDIAENGRAAVDRAVAAWRLGRPYELILMDCQMPEMDGYAATRALREAGYDRPIVALTANALSHERDRCFAAGSDHFLAKPLQLGEFFQVVQGHLRPIDPAAPTRSAAVPADRLVSDLAGDPIIGPLVDTFLAELSGKIETILQALRRDDLAEVSRLAHQIKGSAGSYGFPAITAAAETVESTVQSRPTAGSVAEPVQRLAEICARAAAA